MSASATGNLAPVCLQTSGLLVSFILSPIYELVMQLQGASSTFAWLAWRQKVSQQNENFLTNFASSESSSVQDDFAH